MLERGFRFVTFLALASAKYKSTPSSYLRLKCYDAVNIYEIRTAEISICCIQVGKIDNQDNLICHIFSNVLHQYQLCYRKIVNIGWVFLEVKTCPVL